MGSFEDNAKEFSTSQTANMALDTKFFITVLIDILN